MKEFILQHKRFSFYSLLVAIVVGIAIFAPYITPHDAFNADMSKAFLKPSAEHFVWILWRQSRTCIDALYRYYVILPRGGIGHCHCRHYGG